MWFWICSVGGIGVGGIGIDGWIDRVGWILVGLLDTVGLLIGDLDWGLWWGSSRA